MEANPAWGKTLGYEDKDELLRVEIPAALYGAHAEHEAFRTRVLAEGAIQGYAGRLAGKVAVRSSLRRTSGG